MKGWWRYGSRRCLIVANTPAVGLVCASFDLAHWAAARTGVRPREKCGNEAWLVLRAAQPGASRVRSVGAVADGDGDDERRTTGCCRMRNTKVASKRARARLAGILAGVLEGARERAAFPSAQDAPPTTCVAVAGPDIAGG